MIKCVMEDTRGLMQATGTAHDLYKIGGGKSRDVNGARRGWGVLPLSGCPRHG